MRRLAFLLLVCWTTGVAAAALVFPALTGRVVDEAGVLSPSTENDLTEMLAAHERATGQQVVVATVKSLQGQTIEDYGYQLGRAWGIGEKDKNTGAILLVAPADRQVRIEVGYGLEGTLTDALSRRIIEGAIIPEFRAGRMEAGIVRGAAGIIAALGGKPIAQADQAKPAPQEDGDTIPPIVFIIIVLLFLFLSRRRRGLLPGILLGGPNIWRSGGGSGPRFGGGGGSFGGGGASGRW